MVYIPCSQTEAYPRIKERFTTTNQHFHDKPTAKEPSKKSTFGKLYDNSPYFMDRRLEGKVASAFTSELGNTLGKEDSRLTWTGRLSPSTYVGNGTFQLANGLTYSYRSHKPVKLVPYSQLTKTEYQAQYNRTAAAAEHPRWVSGRAPFTVDYKTTGRFRGE